MIAGYGLSTNMEYKALSRSSLDEISPNISEREARSFSRLHWVLKVNLLLLSLQICLLGWHLIQNLHLDQTRSIATRYGNDQNFMTLDHSFDFLWEDEATKKAGAIVITADKQGQVKEYGVISM